MRATQRGLATLGAIASSVALGVFVPSVAWAQAPSETPPTASPAQPTPAQPIESSSQRVQSAAAEYDAGRRAYMEERYEEAAVHFENAWHDAPRAEALRNAIRSRTLAKQFARAATLAVIGEHHYGDDPVTAALVRETLERTTPQLHKVTLRCSPACAVALDGRAVSLDNDEQFTFFADPGVHDVLASWSEGRAKRLPIDGVAGSAEELSVEAPPLPRPPPRPPSELAPRKPLPPLVVYIGGGLTAAGIAATVISGVDAKNDPGEDAVRRDCVGLGESCPTYQRGREAQLRTNILLGATVGVGVATAVVGLFFTDWSGKKASEPRRARPTLDLTVGGATVGFAGSL